MFEMHGISILRVSRGIFQDKREVGGGVLGSFLGVCAADLSEPLPV